MKNMMAIALCLAAPLVMADSAVEGVYERVSLANVETGFSPERGNRKGLLIMAHGHYAMMTMNQDRRVLADGESVDAMSDSEKIAFLEDWLDVNAHSGRYEADGQELVWYRDVSENPREVGTVSRLNYELRDDLLVISFSLGNGDRYDWVWRRVEVDAAPP